jgi:hypothetical protein
VSTFVWTQVRQALQHAVAMGACSPYFTAASFTRAVQIVFTDRILLARRAAE